MGLINADEVDADEVDADGLDADLTDGADGRRWGGRGFD